MLNKNVEREDVGWQHGSALDDKSRNVNCNYCHLESSSNVCVLRTI
jgi:hypothetical protein